MPDALSPGQRIRNARQARGETLLAASFRTGIDPGNLSRIERGLRKIYAPTRVVLAAAYDLNEADLVDETKTDSVA